jgi:putative PIN family toxin of toxin-antitoxin system
MVRAVLDTNVLISGIYAPDGPPGQVLAFARKGKIENVTSLFILSETERILAEKLHWHKNKIAQTIRWIQSFSYVVHPKETLTVISHASDKRILECAREGKVGFIVSGDRHLRELKCYQEIKIVEPAKFLVAIGEN